MTNHPSDTPQIEHPAAASAASKILTLLGFAQEPSMQPGADERRDRVAQIIAAQLAKLQAERNEAKAELAAYREAHEDHKRLVRELDVVWNGEVGAAKQASLCDVVSQLSREVPQRRAELLALHEILMCPGECPPVAEGDTLTVRLLKGYIAAVDKRVGDLTAWKESALAVMPDFQAIGKVLGVRLGETVHDKILSGIEELSVQIALAREAISRASTMFYCAGNLIAKELMDAALSTLTTGNAVQAIESRAYLYAAELCAANMNLRTVEKELRRLAEQKKQKVNL